MPEKHQKLLPQNPGEDGGGVYLSLSHSCYLHRVSRQLSFPSHQVQSVLCFQWREPALWSVACQDDRVPVDYITTENRRVNTVLGQKCKHAVLSLPYGNKLLSIFPTDRDCDCPCQVTVCFQVPKVVLIYSSKDTTSGIAAAIEATIWPSLWQSTIIHHNLFGFCKGHESELAETEWDSPALYHLSLNSGSNPCNTSWEVVLLLTYSWRWRREVVLRTSTWPFSSISVSQIA